jgi:N-dimethylarginine dimethylaminohydrolase
LTYNYRVAATELDETLPDDGTWGVDSEYGALLDVLLCPPDHYRWLPTSPISQATLDSGARFDAAAARAQHAEMVACYEQEGIRCHFLDADPALPYQVFARDSSTASPAGPVVLQLQQWWRRGEYGPVIEFYRATGIPVAKMITAAAVEGGDVMIIEPGCVLIGCCEARTQEPGARQLAGFFEGLGWEARVQPFSSRFVHLDVLVGSLAEKLAAVCVDAVPTGLVSWLTAKGFDVIDVPEPEAFTLGVNAMPLGRDRVLSTAGATSLNAGLTARGLTVLDPDLSMFTAGGGGAHCLAQALRRERCG